MYTKYTMNNVKLQKKGKQTMNNKKDKEKVTTAKISVSTRNKLKILAIIKQKTIKNLIDDLATKELEIEKKKGIKYLT